MISGWVVHGRGIGTTLGYPTANILPDEPAGLDSGVYAVTVRRDRECCQGVLVVGGILDVVPYSLEAHLLDFTGDLYGQKLTIEVIEKVSDLTRFDSDEELIVKIKADIAKAKRVFLKTRI